MRKIFLTLLVLAPAGLAVAQTATLTGPVQAYAFDAPSHTVRSVQGYPGSAMFGPPVVGDVDFASLAPHQNFGIVFQRGAAALATSLDSTQSVLAPLDGVSAEPDGIAWSADGTLAALYSLSGNWMQLVSGLPETPSASATIDLSQLGGSLTAMTVDTHGKRIAVSIAGQTSGTFLFDPATLAFVPAMYSAGAAGLSFSRDGATLFLVDSSSATLTILDVANLTSQSVALTGLANPIAVHASEDSLNPQLVYVASGTDQLLRSYDLKAQQVVSDTPLAFTPSRIDAFGRNSFVIGGRERPSDPLWLFATGPVPGAYFVPAIPPDTPRIEPISSGPHRPASGGGAR